jgi:hypothetical protein
MNEALRGLLNKEEMQALRERNEMRLWEAQEKLGTRWVCHPNNHVQRKITHDTPLRHPCH